MSPAPASAPPAAALSDADSPFAAELMERQPFTGHRLIACLASGANQAVFKAESAHLERATALKAVRPSPERRGAAEEFFPLAAAVARLRSPGAARALDAGRGGGCFFMAYEFVAGESLAARLLRRQAGRLGEREALKVVRELARLLQELFDLGNHHGHLKPANVMCLPEGGRMRLLDVGFAWTAAWPSDAAAFAADPDFLPPERIAGELNVDIRGDLYSLGAVWHRLLLGEPVFRASAPEEVLRLHLEQAPTPPRERDPRLSAATSGLLLRLLEKDRGARPRTPRDFLGKLSEHPLLEEAEAKTPDPAPAGED